MYIYTYTCIYMYIYIHLWTHISDQNVIRHKDTCATRSPQTKFVLVCVVKLLGNHVTLDKYKTQCHYIYGCHRKSQQVFEHQADAGLSDIKRVRIICDAIRMNSCLLRKYMQAMNWDDWWTNLVNIECPHRHNFSPFSGPVGPRWAPCCGPHEPCSQCQLPFSYILS